MWRYANDDAAVRDALRLSEGMTYKNALAGLPLGGGKAVIRMPDSGSVDRTALLEAFGRCVEQLNGRYLTAEDVGTSVADMQTVARTTKHVSGLPPREGRAGGNPSPWTAKGVFLSIEAAVRHRLGCDLAGVVVGVQGLGNVGFSLAGMLHKAGAKLLVSDTDAERVFRAVHLFDAQAVAPDGIAHVPMDVFAPCALGGVLSEEGIDSLQASIVCGAANNQLEKEHCGALLAKRGVLYCPDYLVNAGGIICVAAEYLGHSPDWVDQRVAAIPQRLNLLIAESEADGEPMNLLAERMALGIVAQGDARRAA